MGSLPPSLAQPPPPPKKTGLLLDVDLLLDKLGLAPKNQAAQQAPAVTPPPPPQNVPPPVQQNQSSGTTLAVPPPAPVSTPPPSLPPAPQGFVNPPPGKVPPNPLAAALPPSQNPGTSASGLVPKAVAAQYAKNQKTQVKRDLGSKLLKQATTAPPPPKPSVTPTTAALNPPPPTEIYTPLQQALYHAPPKGLEYLAAAMALIFPGAPIARAASGFLQGMGQGSEERYKRDSEAAQAAQQAANEQNQVTYANQTAQWNADKDLHTRGLYRLSNGSVVPFKYTPAEHIVGKNVNNPQAWESAYNSLIALAQRNGDTGAVQRFGQELDDYHTQQADIQKVQMQLLEMQHQDFIHTDTETQENYRSNLHEDRADARAAANRDAAATKPRTPQQIMEDNAKYQLSDTRWQDSYKSHTQGYTTQSGTFVHPDVNQAIINKMQPLFKAISASQDPQGLANNLAGLMQNQASKDIIQQWGTREADRRVSQGLPLYPQEYPEPVENEDVKIQKAYNEAVHKGYDVSQPEVIKAILKNAGVEETPGGSNDANPFPPGAPAFPG